MNRFKTLTVGKYQAAHSLEVCDHASDKKSNFCSEPRNNSGLWISLWITLWISLYNYFRAIPQAG